MIVSLHFPKTAGTSFARSLEEHFGGAFLRDYADLPINAPALERNRHAVQACLENERKDFSNVECIHGHFLPLKYLLLGVRREVKFITWMREPVERLASHYGYWLNSYNPSTAPSLHRRVVEEKWSLERFCLGPELQNFYGQFLWGFSLERFDFVGIVEHYEEDFAYCAETFLGRRLPVYQENVGRKGSEQAVHVRDEEFRRAVEAHHRHDVELYQRALAVRQRTRSGWLAGADRKTNGLVA
jgi:hypothetical protein